MSNPPPRNPLGAIGRPRFLLTGWPWRSLGYLLTSLPLSLAVGLPLAVLALPWAALIRRAVTGGEQPIGVLAGVALVSGMLGAVLGPLAALPVAALERRRLRLVDTRPVDSGRRQLTEPGPWAWIRTRYAEPTTWRAVAYVCLLATLAPAAYGMVFLALLLVAAMVASPLLVRDGGGPMSLGVGTVDSVGQTVPYLLAGLLLLPAVPYLLAALAGAHGALARALLGSGSDDRLRTELVEVSRSRARLVDAFEVERRRIERDLHDGAQQRLVSLTLQLGLARLDLAPDTPAARAVADAHEQAKQLMAQLRELIHGIHPRVLTDLGLAAALHDLAEQSAVPVAVRAEVAGRLPPHVESTGYFVAAEALTNVARHSGAAGAEVSAYRRGGLLVVEVGDDGRGGAAPRRGTGLAGLADRVAVTGGRMLLSSPTGGPTLLRVEIPCDQSNDVPSG